MTTNWPIWTSSTSSSGNYYVEREENEIPRDDIKIEESKEEYTPITPEQFKEQYLETAKSMRKIEEIAKRVVFEEKRMRSSFDIFEEKEVETPKEELQYFDPKDLDI